MKRQFMPWYKIKQAIAAKYVQIRWLLTLSHISKEEFNKNITLNYSKNQSHRLLSNAEYAKHIFAYNLYCSHQRLQSILHCDMLLPTSLY